MKCLHYVNNNNNNDDNNNNDNNDNDDNNNNNSNKNNKQLYLNLLKKNLFTNLRPFHYRRLKF